MTLHPQAQLLIDAAEQSELPPLVDITPEQARRHYNLRAANLPVDP